MVGYSESNVERNRSMIVDGVGLCYRRKFGGWLAIFDPTYSVRFLPPAERGDRWRAFRPGALEPIAVGLSLREVFDGARKHHERLRAEARERIAARLRAALADVTR